MKTIQLNTNEKKVLVSLYNQMMDCTHGEFGCIKDADKCGFTKHEFAGYISSLQAKDCFEYLDTVDTKNGYFGQYALTEEAINEARKIQGLVIPVQESSFDELMSEANKLYTESAEESRIAEEYFQMIMKPTKHVSKQTAEDLYADHKVNAEQLLERADALQKQATDLHFKLSDEYRNTLKEKITNTNTSTKTSKIMKNQTRVLTQDTQIGEKTYKAGTKFVIESINYCVMQIKIGKAKISANLNLVKSWASEPVGNTPTVA